MPSFIELEKLLNFALSSPEVGTVNFNILRMFLQEILRHLGIENKAIDIDTLGEEHKSAIDFIKDGYADVTSLEKRSLEVFQVEETPEMMVGPEAESTTPFQSNTEQEQESPPPSALDAEQREGEQLTSVETDPTEESKLDASITEGELSIAPLKSEDLPVKDQPPLTRSSVFSPGGSDSLNSLKRRVSELQGRVEFLESHPPPAVPDPVISVASLVRKESKTPAHDFVELVNIKRTLEASESSLEGLTEMVDALASDLNELKESLPKVHKTSSDLRSDMEELRKSLNAMKEDKAGKEEGEKEGDTISNLENTEQRMDGFESVLANLKEAVAEITENVKDHSQVTDPKGQEMLDAHEKQLQGLKVHFEKVEGKLDGVSSKLSGAEEAAADTLTKLEACGEEINEIKTKQGTLGEGLKNHKSQIKDNEIQIHQLSNLMTLMKRENTERANVEAADKEKEEEREHKSETSTYSRRAYSVDRQELSLIRTMISELQEEKEKLKQADIRLNDELYRKQRHLDDLYNIVDELRDVKVDKELLNMGFELKADKKDVETKIGREDFEHCIGLVDQSLRDLLQRLEGHENALKLAIEAIHSDVGKKLDKEEVEPLKRYLESRMEFMKPKPVERPPPEELAAGIRKRFLVNHNCISCDRPVKYAREEPFPPLPTIRCMPGSKSTRPYTTFELEQIRQHMLPGGLSMTKERFELLEKQRSKLQKEMLRLSGVHDLQELAEATARACGGVHTLTYPHSQSVVRGLQLNKDDLDFLVPQKDFQPVDILGQDGHIYKGLLDSLPTTLPHIPQKSKTSGLKNAPRNVRRSTTPTSPSLQKPAKDQIESC